MIHVSGLRSNFPGSKFNVLSFLAQSPKPQVFSHILLPHQHPYLHSWDLKEAPAVTPISNFST